MEEQLHAWWQALDDDQRARARAIAARPAPRTLVVDDLTASLMMAGLPTSRMVWTGTPEALLEMVDEVAEFVLAQAA